jgi:maltose alpha-D-glucosyltransferase/alpha-amylase
MALHRDCPEIGYGDVRRLSVSDPSVLALRVDWLDGTVVVLHNLVPPLAGQPGRRPP